MAAQLSHKPQFYVVALGTAQAAEAYPLVRAIAPEVSAKDWQGYVQRRCRDGGFKGLFDANDIMIGLFSYRFGERLRQGRVLALDDFVTFEFSQAAPGRKLLMAVAESYALHRGCTGIEVRVNSRGFVDAGARKASGWLALGLGLESVVFTKRFARAAREVCLVEAQ